MTESKLPNENYKKLLNELDKSSKDVLKKLLPIMKNIDEKDSKIIEEIAFITKKKHKTSTIKEWLEMKTMAMLEDAEKVSDEFENFQKNLLLSDQDLEKNVDKYPFLSQVWYGDMFNGKTEGEAIEFLVKEFSEICKNCTEDYFIKECSSSFA